MYALLVKDEYMSPEVFDLESPDDICAGQGDALLDTE